MHMPVYNDNIKYKYINACQTSKISQQAPSGFSLQLVYTKNIIDIHL
jgi:hypothetical protein